MRADTALRLDVALLAALWVASIAAWPTLPDPFPIHFDEAGSPDGWAGHDARGLVVWLLLPVLATLMSLLLRWIPRAARTNPSLWNFPDKARFIALEPAAREPVHATLAESIARVTPLTTCLLLLLQVQIWAGGARGVRVHSLAILMLAGAYSTIAIGVALRGSSRASALMRTGVSRREGGA